ncbi:MAG: hypothetical protein ACFCVK_00905 [Acidimicrobiales bacterium]
MADQLDELTIRFLATSGYLGVSRLNTTTMAAAVGFDVEQLDDLRLAVNEAVTWLLIDDELGGHVELTIACDDRSLRFRGRRTRAGLPSREPDELIHAILGATVDDYQTGEDEDGHRYVTLSKRA